MSLSEWLQSANQYAKKGYSKSQVIEQLGEPPGRITSNGRGGWKKRTGNRQGQAAKRRQFDTTSTDLAATEAKKLESTKRRINGEASLYGLEPTQMEHLADQDDAKAMTAGAPGDPNNKLIVKESDARFKDKVKQSVGKDYSVVNNPSEESVKVIKNKYFDPIADPSTLPGKDIRNSGELRKFLEFIENSNGRISDSIRGISPRARYLGYGANMAVEYGDAVLEIADHYTNGQASKTINGAINSAVDFVKDNGTKLVDGLVDTYAALNPSVSDSNTNYGQ